MRTCDLGRTSASHWAPQVRMQQCDRLMYVRLMFVIRVPIAAVPWSPMLFLLMRRLHKVVLEFKASDRFLTSQTPILQLLMSRKTSAWFACSALASWGRACPSAHHYTR